jgi:hypothetical protein
MPLKVADLCRALCLYASMAPRSRHIALHQSENGLISYRQHCFAQFVSFPIARDVGLANSGPSILNDEADPEITSVIQFHFYCRRKCCLNIVIFFQNEDDEEDDENQNGPNAQELSDAARAITAQWTGLF